MASGEAVGRDPRAKRTRAARDSKREDSGAKRPRARVEASGKPAGERFVPGEGAPLPAYEHSHRYVLAAALLGGRRVLDLACGSGTGSQRLRDAGIDTLALDLDRTFARRAAPGVCADAARLPFSDSVFGGVVCFEAIEHLEEPQRLLAEVARMLGPGGLALISTPDREIFRERAGCVNPYHVSEMTAAEFDALLREHFGHVSILGQSVWSGSWISPLGDGHSVEGAGPRAVRVAAERVDAAGGAAQAPWVDPASEELPTPMFLVALCARSQTGLRTALRKVRDGHLLHDSRQALLGHYVQSMERQVEGDSLIAAHAEHAHNLERIRDEQRERIDELDAHSANLQRIVEAAGVRGGKLEAHAKNLESLASSRGGRIEELEAHVAQLESLGRSRSERIEELEGHLADAQQAHAEARDSSERLRRLSRERSARVQELDGVVAALESDRAELKGLVESLREHVATLDREGSETRSHAQSLVELAEERLGRIHELEGRTATLEHQVTKLEANEVHLRAKAEGEASNSENLAAERDERTARIDLLLEQMNSLQERLLAAAAEKDALEARVRDRLRELGERHPGFRAEIDEALSPDASPASTSDPNGDSGSS